MYCNLKTTILGNYVKVTSVRLKTTSKEEAIRSIKNVNKNKLSNNLVRAKNTIVDIALANDFKYFFTITFSPFFDRFDLSCCLNSFRITLKKMNRARGTQIKYLIVPEQHKNGAWHFHGFFNEDIEKFLYLNDYGFLDISFLNHNGYCNVQLINHKERIASYITKYVSKNLANGIKKFNHSFYCSTGLSRGVEDLDKLYDNEYFNENFFDFSNDFCYRKIISLEEFKKIKPFILTM